MNTLVVLAGSTQSLAHMYTDPAYARADYRGIADRIVSEGIPDAAIVLNGGWLAGLVMIAIWATALIALVTA